LPDTKTQKLYLRVRNSKVIPHETIPFKSEVLPFMIEGQS